MNNFFVILSLVAAGLTYLAFQRPRAYSKTAISLVTFVCVAMLMLLSWRVGFTEGSTLTLSAAAGVDKEGASMLHEYIISLDESLHKMYVAGFAFIGYMLLLSLLSRLIIPAQKPSYLPK